MAVDTLEQRERVELLRDRDGAGTASQPAPRSTPPTNLPHPLK